MTYHRKTIAKWHFDALALTLITLLVGILLYSFKNATKAQAIISPVGSTIVVEVPVYVEPVTIEDKIRAEFGDDAGVMLRVAFCESSMNPNAKNKTSTATGLFQVMASVHNVGRNWLTDPDINIKIAKQLFDKQGLKPWEASRWCWER